MSNVLVIKTHDRVDYHNLGTTNWVSVYYDDKAIDLEGHEHIVTDDLNNPEGITLDTFNYVVNQLNKWAGV